MSIYSSFSWAILRSGEFVWRASFIWYSCFCFCCSCSKVFFTSGHMLHVWKLFAKWLPLIDLPRLWHILLHFDKINVFKGHSPCHLLLKGLSENCLWFFCFNYIERGWMKFLLRCFEDYNLFMQSIFLPSKRGKNLRIL